MQKLIALILGAAFLLCPSPTFSSDFDWALHFSLKKQSPQMETPLGKMLLPPIEATTKNDLPNWNRNGIVIFSIADPQGGIFQEIWIGSELKSVTLNYCVGVRF